MSLTKNNRQTIKEQQQLIFQKRRKRKKREKGEKATMMKKGYNYYKGSRFKQQREELEAHGLDMIRRATRDILDNGTESASKMSFEELYRNVYNLVLSKRGDTLYSDLTRNIKDRLAHILAELKKSSDASFLECLSQYWTKYELSLKCIKDVFIYFVNTNNYIFIYYYYIHGYLFIFLFSLG